MRAMGGAVWVNFDLEMTWHRKQSITLHATAAPRAARNACHHTHGTQRHATVSGYVVNTNNSNGIMLQPTTTVNYCRPDIVPIVHVYYTGSIVGSLSTAKTTTNQAHGAAQFNKKNYNNGNTKYT